MSENEVIVKRVPAMKVVSLRAIVPTPANQTPLWQSLRDFVTQQDIRPDGPWISLYHDGIDQSEGCDVEVCAPLSNDARPAGDIDIREIPAIEMAASLVFRGPLERILDGYAVIESWMTETGHHKAARCREVYLQEPENDSDTDPDTVVEIQMPVSKG